MRKLLWRVCRSQCPERYRRRFLIVFRFVLYDIEDLVSILRPSPRREDGDYVVGLDMCPLGVWGCRLVSRLGQFSI